MRILLCLLVSLSSAQEFPPVLGNPPAQSVEDWEKKVRPETYRFFETQIYGKAPLEKPPFLIFSEEEPDPKAMNGLATKRVVTISYGNTPKNSGQLRAVFFVPNEVSKPAPAFILICNRGFEEIDPKRTDWTGFWPADEIVKRGYVAAAFFNGDADPDEADDFKKGIHAVFPTEDDGSSWGTIAAWGWGASRILDFFKTIPEIDEKKVAVIGHSRGGKAALWAGARDERFALTISNNSGCTGAALAKRKQGETVERINTVFPHWFCGNYSKWNAREDEMPYDQHQLVALIAPRLVYVASAEKDRWADPEGEFLAAKLAGPVYELFGKKGVGSEKMPEVGKPLHTGSIGYHIREGKHNLRSDDWGYYMDFADRHWK
ncbi:MAG: dienelactone hydrolase family protein [Akkermansiaceae bacterium]